MTAPAPVSSSANAGWVLTWLRRSAWDLLPIAGLIVSCIAFVFVSLSTAGLAGLGEFFTNGFAYVWVIVWMLAVTFVVRTIGFREVLVAFLGGFFTSVLLVHLLAKPLIAIAGVTPFVTVYAVPTLEELAKLVPLLLLLLAYRRRRGEHAGVSDLVVAGFAVGSGVGLHEDLLYGRAVTSSNGQITGVFNGALGVLFPNFFVGGGTTLVAHAGWGTVIGLGVGVSALLWRRFRYLALIPGAVGVLISLTDHSTWNDSSGPWIGDVFTAGHRVAFIVTVLAIPAAVVTDVLLRRRHRSELPRPSLRIYPYLVRRLGGPVEVLLRLLAYGHYRRGWNAEAYAAARGIPIEGVNPRLDAWLVVTFPPTSPRTLRASVR